MSIEWHEVKINDLSLWPMRLKIKVALCLFFLILIGGFDVIIQPLLVKLKTESKMQQTLKEAFAAKYQALAMLPLYHEQMQSIKDHRNEAEKRLPVDNRLQTLIEAVSAQALRCDLMLTSIRLLPEAAEDFYIALPMEISVTGSYHALVNFLNQMTMLPRIVTVHDFSLEKHKETLGNEAVTLTFLAKAYRYVYKEVKQ